MLRVALLLEAELVVTIGAPARQQQDARQTENAGRDAERLICAGFRAPHLDALPRHDGAAKQEPTCWWHPGRAAVPPILRT